MDETLFRYLLRMGDNALILGQRLSEWVAHGPALEEDMALANFALDFIGEARMLYSCAGEVEGRGRTEDDFAYRRDCMDFCNVLLVEQPNGDFGETIARQVLFESFHGLQLEALTACRDERLAAIAGRALKESQYHLRHAAHWLVRLGDGTEESHRHMQRAVDKLWRFTGELFAADEVDEVMRDRLGGPDLATLQVRWDDRIDGWFAEATLARPGTGWMATGGKQGRHSEQLGYLLAELQFLQRAYPEAVW